MCENSIKNLQNLCANLSILYVEDDENMQNIMKNGILNMFFKAVYTASDGEEGLLLYTQNRPDIILTDISMPKLNGIEMSKKIRETDHETPIIILSAHSDTDFFLESIELDINGYVIKPIKEGAIVNVLKKCVQNLIDKRELARFREAELAKKDLMIEYQKNKIANYNTLIQELLFMKYYKKEDEVKRGAIKEGDFTKTDSLLSEEEVNILRKRQGSIISAIDYLKELDEDLSEDMSNLSEIEKDLKDAISDFEDSPCVESFYRICEYVQEYVRYMKQLIEFENLASALGSLVVLMEGLGEDDIGKKSTKIALYLNSIHSDLSAWRDAIFVSCSTKDIHYLDSSLFSSVLQMELDIKTDGFGGAAEEGNDIELF